MTRAERRHQMERAKRRVQRRRDTDDPAIVGKLARTRRRCSCQYCHGHARDWEGRTMQERRAPGGYDDDPVWDALFARSLGTLQAMAEEALAEARAGRTMPLAAWLSEDGVLPPCGMCNRPMAACSCSWRDRPRLA